MAYIQYIDFENDRFGKYSRNSKLYEGLHYDVFNINQFEYYKDATNQYIVYNYFEILTNAFSNLIWSEEPEIRFENKVNQEFFDSYASDDGFFLKMRQSSETSSHSGEAILQVMLDDIEPGKYGVTLNQIDNSMWFPIFDKANPSKKPRGHIKYIEKEIDKSKDKVVLLEIHTAGKIEWESYKLLSNREYQEIDPLQYFKEELENVLVDNLAGKNGAYAYNTSCKYPLIQHLPNHKQAGKFFGVSDYTQPVISKVYAMNQNYNQIQYVLKKHAHPKMVVPKEVIKQAINQITSDNNKAIEFNFQSKEQALMMANGERNLFETLVAQKLIDKLEFYGSDINSSDPKYLTWDGNLNESREQIGMLKQALFEETQLAKVLIDPEVSTGAASGVAILRLAQPSLHKAVMKQAYVKDTMGKLIYTILDLAKNAGVEGSEGLEPEIPSVKFRDGLVNDLKELIDQQEILLNNQLTSKIDAIMNTQDLTREQAQTKFNEIQNENNLFGGDIPGNSQNNL